MKTKNDFISDKDKDSEPKIAGFASAKNVVLYTADTKLFDTDEIFARFLTGDEKFFIVEDADHVLKSRAAGNENLHRFLTISDGIFKALGKKIIFTTNLPNLSDLDDALSRKGRCFAHEIFRPLTQVESIKLAQKIDPSFNIMHILKPTLTVADVYAEVNTKQ
jgi:hypothetical protein